MNSNIVGLALITGAGRGIGAETAKLFARKGYLVAINFRSDREAAEQVATEIEQQGGQSILVQYDVSQEQQVAEMFAQLDQKGVPLKVLVNNAGILYTQCRFEEIDLARFEAVYRTNVIGTFLCTQQAISRMSTAKGGQGGSIVNVSSIASRNGSANEYVDYAASKGAIDSMTRGLGKELANEGIRVNAVRPGLIYTQMHADGGEPGRVDRLAPQVVPMQRGGQAVEVAEAIYWLASDSASFTTGAFIDVAGGM